MGSAVHQELAKRLLKPGNGHAKELPQALRQLQEGEMPYRVPDELFDRMDLNKDGVISGDEFRRFELEAAPAEPTPKGLDRLPPALRYATALQVPHSVLVGFLSAGYGFDDSSVAEAVRQANEHFAGREVTKALDVYGAAYELGRLNYDYRPLLHDLLLRRVLCYSMLGRFQEGLHECKMALKIIPNAATGLLLQGLLHSKLHEVDEANEAFQWAVMQNRELRDIIDCLIALFMMGQGENDRAIQICGRVLERSGHPFARLVRGDAYKFHASGYFTDKAMADYAAVLDFDMGAQSLMGECFTQEQHARADELLLRFHPRLLAEGPRRYEKYPLYGQRQPFLVVALVLFAVGKLKAWVRSTKLVKDVQMQREELLRQRAAAEHRMLKLFEAQQKVATYESHPEVWGPAQPLPRVRKYRRYWMERPLDFPRRERDAGGAGPRSPGGRPQEASLTCEEQCQQDKTQYNARDELFARIDLDGDGVISREEFHRFVLEAKAPGPCGQWAPASSLPPDRGAEAAAAAALAAGGSGPEEALAACGLAAASPKVQGAVTPRTPTTTAGGATVACTPEIAGGEELPSLVQEPSQLDLSEMPERLLPKSSEHLEGDSGSAVDTLTAASMLSASAAAEKKLGPASPSLEVAARLARSPAPSVEAAAAAAAKQRSGHDWSEEQWLAKALQLTASFNASGGAALPGRGALRGGTPVAVPAPPGRPLPRPPPVPEPQVPPTSTVVMLPVAGAPGRSASNTGAWGSYPPTRKGSKASRVSSKCSGVADAIEEEEEEEGFMGVHMPGVPAGQKVPLNLVEAIEEYGFDVLPDWYGALDRIYETTEMAPFGAEPEPAVPVPGLAGLPGYSYVVPKSPLPSPREQSCTSTDTAVQQSTPAVAKPSEQVKRRYQSRLVATRLPACKGVSQPPAPLARGAPKCGGVATNKVDLPQKVPPINFEADWDPPRYRPAAKENFMQVYL